MELYHGSNVEVKEPKILENLRALDFGAGFYVTTSKEQAMRWAKTISKKRGGKPIVNYYTFDEEVLSKIDVLVFKEASEDWLEFVVQNRKNVNYNKTHDLVIGPVANDSTLPVIDNYIDGVYSIEEAIKRLLPQNLTDQYAFLSDKALQYVQFLRSEQI